MALADYSSEFLEAAETLIRSPTSLLASQIDSISRETGEDDVPKKQYDVNQHHLVPMTRWCIDAGGLHHFDQEVKKLWNDDKIKECTGFEKSEGFDDEEIGPNIYEVVEHYVKPFTKDQGGMSWALWWNNENNPDLWWEDENHGNKFDCDLFATHAWQEGVFEFIDKVNKAWPPDARRLYCCFLANPQNEGGIDEILRNPDIEQSPFAQCLQTACHFLVIPNSSVSIYTRLWCVFEAHKAIERGIDIRIPTSAPCWKYSLVISLAMVIFCMFAALGFFVLAKRIAWIMIPMLWIIVAWALTWAGKSFIDFISARYLGRRSRPLFQVASSYFQIATLATGFSISMWIFKRNGNRTTKESVFFKAGEDTYFQGEGWACVPLMTAFLLSAMWHICGHLNQEVVNSEGLELQFTSVQEAICTMPGDRAKIMKAIKGKEDKITATIKILKRIGKYTGEYDDLIAGGLRPELVREGFDPFQLVCIVYAWEYWLVVDLSFNLHHYYAEIIPIGSCVLVLIIGTILGLRVMFVIEIAEICGLIYVVSSNLVLIFVGHEDPEDKYLSLQTLPVLIICLALTIVCRWTNHLCLRKCVAPQDSESSDDDEDAGMQAWHCTGEESSDDASTAPFTSSRSVHAEDGEDEEKYRSAWC